MRFYQDNEGEWYRTQADAKANATSFKPVDVPTDQAGLLAFLITYRAELLDSQLSVPIGTLPPPTASQTTLSADQVADWLLNKATATEIEWMFASLGARFHEMRTKP